jgi:hypothetical protein
MNDLFAPLDEAKRLQLRQLGWQEVVLYGRTKWRCPHTQGLFTEEEAFLQLERLQEKENLS